MIKEKKFYIALFWLVIPMIFQDLLKHGLNLADNIMIGMLSEIELSAVNLANQPFFLFSIMIFGLVSGSAVLIAQYYGKNDFTAINKIISITVTLALIFTLIWTYIILAFPEYIMRIFINDNKIVVNGVRYLKIIGWTYLLYGINSTLVLILRNLRIIKFTLLINTIAFFINIILDWGFIFGNLNLPQLRVEGAAIATLIARIFETIAIIFYANHCDKQIKIKLTLKPDKILLKDFLSCGFPVFINESIWAIGVVIYSIILTKLGTQTIVAANITSTLEQFFSIIIFPIAHATCIIIGNEIGHGDEKYAKQCARTLFIIAIIFGFILGLALFLSRVPIVNFYNIELATKLLTLQFIDVTSILIFIDSIGIITIVGILRGGGDTKFAMYIDILSVWLVSLPTGILALFCHLPTLIIFIALRMDIIVRTFFCILRLRNDNWIKNVTR